EARPVDPGADAISRVYIDARYRFDVQTRLAGEDHRFRRHRKIVRPDRLDGPATQAVGDRRHRIDSEVLQAHGRVQEPFADVHDVRARAARGDRVDVVQRDVDAVPYGVDEWNEERGGEYDVCIRKQV